MSETEVTPVRMNFIEKESEPTSELIELVRETRTLDGGVELYKNAEISVKTFDSNELFPSAKYVLKSNLDFVARMREEIMRAHGVDILKLREIFGDSVYVVAPPVVELSDGVPVIVDGLHRCTLARRLGESISVIYVEGVDLGYPIISTPVTWDRVVEYETKPEDPTLLRDVRLGIQDDGGSLRRFYRDLSYLGSLGRRPRSGQTG